MNLLKIKTLVNKYLVDFVYNAARIEGVNTNYLDTKLLVEDDIEPKTMDSHKVSILRNLKDAYKELMDESFLSLPIDLCTLQKVNSIINGRGLVQFPGYVRTETVYITNCKYIPPIPNQYDINNHIIDLTLQNKSKLDIGLEIYFYVMRSQPFIDGNKRTANVFANLYLLQNDCGVISVHADKKKQFLKLLSSFYETNDYTKLKDFILKNGYFDIKS